MTKPAETPTPTPPSSSRWSLILLLVCVLLVSFWQIMAWRARRGFESFKITPHSLADFSPHIKGFNLKEMLLREDPLQPNIVSFHVKPARKQSQRTASPTQTVLIRLAHGYNVVDCMRIKHYDVKPLPTPDNPFPCQRWQMTSSINDRSIWMTSMHSSETFAPVDMDTRDMPFPKIGTPDDPGWNPTGLKMTSLRRPLYNLKRLLRARWNNARCDLLTFLQLRRPVYASDEVLTLVSTVALPPSNNGNTQALDQELMRMQQEVHAAMARELIRYRQQETR